MFGGSWGAIRAHLGALGTLLRHSWGALGASWAALGTLLAALGALLGRLGALLDASWALLDTSWRKYRKNLEGSPLFEAILAPKIEAKSIKNRLQKATHSSQRNFNVFCNLFAFYHAR